MMSIQHEHEQMDLSTGLTKRERSFINNLSPANVETIVKSVSGIIASILIATEVVLLQTPFIVSDDFDERIATFSAISMILLVALPNIYRKLGRNAVGARLKRALIQVVLGVVFIGTAIVLQRIGSNQERTFTVAGFTIFLAALDLCVGVAFNRRGILETHDSRPDHEQ